MPRAHRGIGENGPRLRPRWRRGVLCLAILLASPGAARSATIRRVFEPTDLELEDPGVAQFDMAFGLVRGQDAFRLSMPDFEFDLGLTEDVELDLDGEFALGGPDTGVLEIDRLAQDNLLTALKIGFATFEDKDDEREIALGGELGPVWPIAPGAQGVGVEGLALIGLRLRDDYFALNLGALMQPGDAPGQPRAQGFVGGVDAEIGIDRRNLWALTAQVGGASYWSPDLPQVTTTLGLQYSASENLDISVTGLRGWLRGGDQYGILFGITPRFTLW